MNEDNWAVYPSLRGKRVLITGGGSGIGAGMVEGFVRQGPEVTFFDIAREDSRALADRLGCRFEQVDRYPDARLLTGQEYFVDGGWR